MLTFEEIRELAFKTGVADHEGYDCTYYVVAFANAVWQAAEDHYIATGKDEILALQAQVTLLRGEAQMLREALIKVSREAVS